MTAEADMMKLYSTRILALAAQVPHVGRLNAPDGTARQRSPLCGSTVTVDVVVRDGVISQFAQDVKACALGQAAAAVVGAAIIGLDRATVQRGRDEMAAMLKDNGPVPTAPFDGLAVLEPARDYKNRHASILLTFDATLAALDAVQVSA
ncbi:NifU homolog involved in Fe-S cluster formation [Loktanella sp. DSM 29012]|uniref:iron-sulfur cluster assembly scaffold protein n=1 Tax=Loktanella sp. DSM 29012 TaxID=1881056 RepID=UPI0008B5145A|nr:iron-sulfur cluster assembly scaffold protein [Loktanella sp. DSM 29012]SEQ24752.1 NifU homolog involved in Fe-S cluster formation [Loktanella sp. DSM 29012]